MSTVQLRYVSLAGVTTSHVNGRQGLLSSTCVSAADSNADNCDAIQHLSAATQDDAGALSALTSQGHCKGR